MTNIAMPSNSPKLPKDDSNAWAEPWKLPLTVSGIPTSITVALIFLMASLRAKSGGKLKDSVTDGI